MAVLFGKDHDCSEHPKVQRVTFYMPKEYEPASPARGRVAKFHRSVIEIEEPDKPGT